MNKGTMFAVALAILAQDAVAANTDWNNFQGDASHTGFAAVHSDPAKIYPLWTHNVFLADKASEESSFKHIFGGIAVKDDVAYISLYGYKFNSKNTIVSIVMAFNTTTGKTIWRKVLDNAIKVSAPVLASGKVIVSIDKDDSSSIIALQPSSGDIDYELPQDEFKPFAPQVFGDDLYFRSSSNNSLNASTGKINWTSANTTSANFIPALTEDYIMLPMHHGLEALDRKTGRAAFTIDAPGSFSDELKPIYPVYNRKDNAVYVLLATNDDANSNYSLYAMDLKTHQIKWQSKDHYTQPILADNEIFELNYSDGLISKLNAIDPATGKVTWSWADTNVFNMLTNDPIIATKDLVFAASGTGLLGISRTTHVPVWKSKKFTNHLAIADNKLFSIYFQDGDAAISVYALS